MLSKQRIFVDMDGVLAKFNPIAKVEDLYTQGYFAKLPPQQNVVNAIKTLITDNKLDVYILSAALDSPYAKNEKNLWLNKYLPEINEIHRVFTEYGQPKENFIIGGIKNTDILLDDYTVNLNGWCPPGQGIKCLNGINGTHGTWQGAKISASDTPQQIVEQIYMFGMQHNYLAHHEMFQSLHEYESKFQIPEKECLVEMNQSLNRWQPKVGFSIEKIENVQCLFSKFEIQRKPNSIQIKTIEDLCEHYSDKTVFSILNADEKSAFIDAVEIKKDWSEHISETENSLYNMATIEQQNTINTAQLTQEGLIME